MAQMWYIDASSLPFEKRSELYRKLDDAGWGAFEEAKDYLRIGVMVNSDVQAKAVSELIPNSCRIEKVGS